MKIEIDENDIDYINRINSSIEKGEDFPILLREKGDYSVSFRVTDIAKANNFLLNIIMYPNKERERENIEKFGVKFTEVRFDSERRKANELRTMLEKFLKELGDEE